MGITKATNPFEGLISILGDFRDPASAVALLGQFQNGSRRYQNKE